MQRKKQLLFFFLLTGLFFATACSPYQRILKSDDISLKYQAAEKYYNKGDYTRAYPLLEELVPVYRGTAQGEKIYYMYANTNYKLHNYYLAGYHFKTYAEAYPLSENSEEAYYMHAYCLYLESPRKDLDQGSTKNAIDAFHLFINKFPNSSKIELSNKFIDELVDKLERKELDNAMLYYKIEDYKSSLWALRNYLIEFPASPKREEIQFLIVKSAYLLASNSIETKKEERFYNTVQSYLEFKERFPGSKYIGEADKYYNEANNQIQKIKVKNKK
jgi:outer membrane protein assembly factor BamD